MVEFLYRGTARLKHKLGDGQPKICPVNSSSTGLCPDLPTTAVVSPLILNLTSPHKATSDSPDKKNINRVAI